MGSLYDFLEFLGSSLFIWQDVNWFNSDILVYIYFSYLEDQLSL